MSGVASPRTPAGADRGVWLKSQLWWPRKMDTRRSRHGRHTRKPNVMQITLPAPTGVEVRAAIERFEAESGMDSDEFVERFLAGNFGRIAWARAWFDLLQAAEHRVVALRPERTKAAPAPH